MAEIKDYTHSLPAPAAALALLLLSGGLAAEEAPPADVPPAAAAEPAAAAGQTGQVFVPAQGAPATHTVVKGDTLWDISATFLRDPWKWPEIWKVNPQIQNPHLIYPGDVIALTYDGNGRPVLTASRNGQPYMTTAPAAPTTYTTEIGSAPAARGVVKVSPRIRTVPLEEAIPTIPLDVIRPFLARNAVIDPDDLDDAPYVMRTVDGRLLAGAGDRIYVRELPEQDAARFTVVRIGVPYKDPDNGDVLGYEGLHVGEGVVEKYGDPGILALEASRREVQQGDRLMAGLAAGATEAFTPRAAPEGLDGKIISVVDGVGQVGQFAVVVLNRGSRHGLKIGDVMAVMQARGEAKDKVGGLFAGSVDLPDERTGEVMVFRAYDRVSYALVMRATSEIHIGDAVRAPN